MYTSYKLTVPLLNLPPSTWALPALLLKEDCRDVESRGATRQPDASLGIVLFHYIYICATRTFRFIFFPSCLALYHYPHISTYIGLLYMYIAYIRIFIYI